jgi:hypothetical protein
MNEKVSTEQSSMNSSEQQPQVDKQALFARLLGVRYPMAQDTPEEQEIQQELKDQA